MSGKSEACGMTWREERLWAEVRALGYPYDDFTALDQCGDALGERVLLAVLEWACYGQNVQGIEMGRGKLAEAPRAWLAAHIVSTVRRGFEYGDDWNFRRLLEAAERLLECGKTGSVPTGTLRVDMAETLLCYQMQPVIRAFRERAPQVRLIVRSCNCMQIPQGVRTGACDLGVGYDMDWNREALEVESMGSYDIVLLASPDFTEPDFTTPGQRKAASLVTDEPDSIFRRRLEAYLRQREIELDVTLELWSIETIKRCVMSNLGFTYLPRFVAEEELAAGKLVELEAPISGMPAPALCAWRKGRWVTPAMELFLELLREALSEGEDFTARACAPGSGPSSEKACQLK